MFRNTRPICFGLGGRFEPESVAGLNRHTHAQFLIDLLLKKFNVYLEQMNVKNKYTNTLFGREFKKLCPIIKRQRLTDEDERGYFYIFPSLEECRKQFCSSMRFEIPWDDF